MKTYSSLPVERTILLGFLSVITAGAFFIWFFGLADGRPLPFLDALFTATSATCVTGLIVVDTALLPFASQMTLLVLMQLGGLGVMTVTTAMLVFIGGKVGIHEGLYLASGLNLDSPSGARKLVLRVWGIALLIEAAGTCALYAAFRSRFAPGEALWHSLFHSVSAFCNAGFSTFSDGLVSYAATLGVPGTVMVLIVLGGLGFLSVHELWRALVFKKRLSPHTVLVLGVTAFLIAAGTAFYFFPEKNASLKGLDAWGWRAWNALFMSISSRTAGFNTIPMGRVGGVGAFVLCGLMLVGASPGSTGGGIKTTTFGLLGLSVFANLRGETQVTFRRRAIPSENVLLALSVAALYILMLLVGAGLLRWIEPQGFKGLFFEAASALGTVGLSLDVTPTLSGAGKATVILLMFLGRVGILTFVYGFTGRAQRRGEVAYPETGIPVG